MACVRASFCKSAMLLAECMATTSFSSPPSNDVSLAPSSSSSSYSCVIAINPYSAHTFPSDSPWFRMNSGPMARNNAWFLRTLTRYNPGKPRNPLAATVCPTAGDHPSTRAPTSKSSSSSPRR